MSRHVLVTYTLSDEALAAERERLYRVITTARERITKIDEVERARKRSAREEFDSRRRREHKTTIRPTDREPIDVPGLAHELLRLMPPEPCDVIERRWRAAGWQAS